MLFLFVFLATLQGPISIQLMWQKLPPFVSINDFVKATAKTTTTAAEKLKTIYRNFNN